MARTDGPGDGDRGGWRGRPDGDADGDADGDRQPGGDGYGYEYGYREPEPGHDRGAGQPGGYGPPPRRGRNWLVIALIGGGLLAVLVAVVAITTPGLETADPADRATSSPASAEATATPTTSTPMPTGRAPAPIPSPRPEPKATSEAPPLMAVVPNVVGKDLQSAQEELFPPLRSTSIDATGQGRSQVIDSNWVVVRQEPAAGTTVLILTDIKLYVVKAGESDR
jgi:hypothetical protein